MPSRQHLLLAQRKQPTHPRATQRRHSDIGQTSRLPASLLREN
jgi:hypothetical protein